MAKVYSDASGIERRRLMINSPCTSCLLKDKCEAVGIDLEDMRKLVYLAGQDATDLFALGMAEFTIKNKNGNFTRFQGLLDENPIRKICYFS